MAEDAGAVLKSEAAGDPADFPWIEKKLLKVGVATP